MNAGVQKHSLSFQYNRDDMHNWRMFNCKTFSSTYTGMALLNSILYILLQKVAVESDMYFGIPLVNFPWLTCWQTSTARSIKPGFSIQSFTLKYKVAAGYLHFFHWNKQTWMKVLYEIGNKIIICRVFKGGISLKHTHSSVLHSHQVFMKKCPCEKYRHLNLIL